MNCDVGEATEELETWIKRRQSWRMSCDVGEVTESLENEQSSQLYSQQSSFSKLSVASPTSQLILQPFPRFTYVTARSPILPSLYVRHSSFSNTSVASPMSQVNLQPFFRFSYVTGLSLTSHCEPSMVDPCIYIRRGPSWPVIGIPLLCNFLSVSHL